MLELIEFTSHQLPITQLKQPRPGSCHHYGRVAGDDELRPQVYSVLQQRQKRQLPQRTQRRLRLIQQVQPAAVHTTLKESHERLPMTPGIQITVVTGFTGSYRTQVWRLNPPQLQLRHIRIVQSQACSIRQQLCIPRVLLPDVSKKILCTQEQAATTSGGPFQTHAFRQRSDTGKSNIISRMIRAASCRQISCDRKRFEQGALTAAVLPHQHGYPSSELDAAVPLHQW